MLEDPGLQREFWKDQKNIIYDKYHIAQSELNITNLRCIYKHKYSQIRYSH